MSLLGDIVNVAKSAVSTVENVAGDAAKLGGDLLNGGMQVAGGLAQVGGDLLPGLLGGGIPGLPINPFEVIKGAEGLAGKFLGGGLGDIFKNIGQHCPSTGGSNGGGSSTGDAGGVSEFGGSSVLAVLMALARKERNSLYDKVDKLKNLQVPGEGASKQEQADYESTRDELKTAIQSLQSEIQTVVTMATNLEKNSHDTEMSIGRNMA